MHALLALLLSGAAFFFGTGLHPIWWLTWLAAIPVLVVAPRLSWPSAFGVAFFAWAAGAINQWHFFLTAIHVPLGTVVLFTALPSLVFALTVLAYRRFLLIGSIWRGALIVPCIWVLAEFITAGVSIHGTAGNISYSQMNFLPILQIASLTGIWGISFCLFLFASTASILLGRYGARRGRLWLGVAVFASLAGVFGFGVWRLVSTPATSSAVKVGLVSSDLPQNLITQKHDDTLRLLTDYVSQAQKLAAQGAKVVVFPEKIAVVVPSDIAAVDSLMQSTAKQTGAQIIVGVVDVTRDARWNQARVYSPSAEMVTYEKHHMLPPFESNLKPGTRLTELQQPSGLWGVAICKDMDFPKMGLDYGNDGVGLMLVPAWDFVQDGWQHGRMAILRGVESGFSIARSPKQGILTVTDDRGRVLAEANSASAPFATIIATVPVRNDRTFYVLHGNWFAWVNIGLFIVLMGSAFVVRMVEGEPGKQPSDKEEKGGV